MANWTSQCPELDLGMAFTYHKFGDVRNTTINWRCFMDPMV